MQTIENLRIVLQQLGSAVAEINAIVEDESGSWQIFFQDDYAISLNLSDDQKTIELVAVLGAPDPVNELDVLRTMLCYQLLWRSCLEPRVALDEKLGSLICFCEYESGLLNNSDFDNYLISFWRECATLTEMVAAGISISLPPATAEILQLHA